MNTYISKISCHETTNDCTLHLFGNIRVRADDQQKADEIINSFLKQKEINSDLKFIKKFKL